MSLATCVLLWTGAAAAQETMDAGVTAPEAGLPVEPAPSAREAFFRALPLSVGVFGNFDGTASGQGHPSFVLGGVDLFLTSQPYRKLNLLAELVFEAGSDQNFVVDVERVSATWLFDRLLRVTVGRIHQALGYYNAAYHHGAYLANTIERPAAVAFEDGGGILPVHAIGIEAAGDLDFGNFSLGYNLTVSNGRGRFQDEILNVRDLNPSKAVLGAITLSQIDWGVRIGLNALYDRIPTELDADGATLRPPQDEMLLGAHLLIDTDVVWFLAEGYLVDHTSTALGKRRTIGFFAEGRVNFRPVYAYARFDLISHDEQIDPFYDLTAPLPSTRSVLLGLGWKVISGLVLKVEAAVDFPQGLPVSPSGRAQLAWSL